MIAHNSSKINYIEFINISIVVYKCLKFLQNEDHVPFHRHKVRCKEVTDTKGTVIKPKM